jgi:putative hydrolase of the HAD superfamily
VRYQAVFFDLVGTLCDFPLIEFDRLLADMAAALGILNATFEQLWPAAYTRQETGAALSIEESLWSIGQQAGVTVDRAQVCDAAALWRAFQARILTPRVDAQDTLYHLKASGHKLGLVANQPVDVPALWRRTPLALWFECAIFSCEAHVRKPDPRIYHLACQQLQVPAHRCLFVGDGGSAELSGAQRAGMDALRIRVPSEDVALDRRLGREAWTGATVSKLNSVVSFCIAARI